MLYPILILGFLCLTIIIPPTAYAQNNSTSTQTTTGGSGVDPATVATVGVGGAAGVIAIVKQLVDQKTNTKRDKSTDGDAGLIFSLLSKYFQAKYLYPHMTDKEILDLPVSNNPMSKMTLGQAITSEADKWVSGNQQYWNIPMPQMSVPTTTTVEAVKGSTAAAAAHSSTQPPTTLGNK